LSKGGLFKGRKREKNETTRAEKPPRRRVRGTPTAKTTPPACGDRRLARDSSRLRPAFVSRVSQSPRIATRKIVFLDKKKLVDHVHHQRAKKKNSETASERVDATCTAPLRLLGQFRLEHEIVAVHLFFSLSSLDRTLLWSRDVVCTLLCLFGKEEEESL
jgi:hypothetical protein